MVHGRRHLRWVLLALAAVALLAPSTTSLTVTAADRPVTAAVAADDEAFLGIVNGPIALPNGNHEDVVLVEVTNRVPNTRTIDVQVRISGDTAGPPPILRDVDGIDSLTRGETGTVTADIACGNASDRVDVFDVHIIATSEDVEITVTESVRVTCTGEPPEHAADD